METILKINSVDCIVDTIYSNIWKSFMDMVLVRSKMKVSVFDFVILDV